ncbi:hypothetical protein ADUPG1_011442 [Aduncisulcus paluster]|uniref:Uncharacterized protein n=1 Tax=Aduncisulcus paluster TaxID=2918883 RepID=A0ABQ5JXM2_9EUKA|nr:hypothetical protein ADUPG1_011442 [Aduncisulcus paluster]
MSRLKEVYELVSKLFDHDTRTESLLKLAQIANEGKTPELATILCYSSGINAVIIEELCIAYNFIEPPTISKINADRIVSVIRLVKEIALTDGTATFFTNLNMHILLIPFIDVFPGSASIELVRTSALAVFCSLLQKHGSKSADIVKSLRMCGILEPILHILMSGEKTGLLMAFKFVELLSGSDSGLKLLFEGGLAVFQTLKFAVSRLKHRVLSHSPEQLATASEATRGDMGDINGCLTSIVNIYHNIVTSPLIESLSMRDIIPSEIFMVTAYEYKAIAIIQERKRKIGEIIQVVRGRGRGEK